MWPFNKIQEQLQRITQEQIEISKLLAEYNGSLKEHMKRCDLLEQGLEKQERRLDSFPQKALTAVSLISALVILVKSVLT
jgi:chromosome segregation ATPase